MADKILIKEVVETKIIYKSDQGPPGAGAEPADTVVSETTYGQSSTAGVGERYARDDHTHGTPSKNDLNPDYITFDTTPEGVPVLAGTLSWNAEDLTLEVLQNGTKLQIGQEVQWPSVNKDTVDIANGTPVMYTGSTGATGRINIAKMDGTVKANARSFLGLATEVMLKNAEGKTTDFGKLHDIQTNGGQFGETWVDGDLIYVSPTTIGYLTNVKPTRGQLYVVAGLVVNAHPTSGVIVTRVIPINENLLLTPDESDAIEGSNSPSSSNPIATIADIPTTYQDNVTLHTFAGDPLRNSEVNIHGELSTLITGDTLSTGVDITGSNGISKLFLAAKAGTDFNGSFTVTGTVVDRDTGVESAGSDVIAVDALTIDNTALDANGNIRHDLQNGYMTDSWFTGAYTISTTDLNLSDVDVYQVAFYQFGEEPIVAITKLDTTIKITNATADFAVHLYSVKRQAANKFNIQIVADVEVTAPVVPRSYRLSRGLTLPLDCTTDGIFVDVFFNAASTYFENFDMAVKAEIQRTL